MKTLALGAIFQRRSVRCSNFCARRRFVHLDRSAVKPVGRKIIAHSVSRGATSNRQHSPGTGRKSIPPGLAFVIVFTRTCTCHLSSPRPLGQTPDFRPVPGLGIRATPFRTAHAEGYYLSPSGLEQM